VTIGEVVVLVRQWLQSITATATVQRFLSLLSAADSDFSCLPSSLAHHLTMLVLVFHRDTRDFTRPGLSNELLVLLLHSANNQSLQLALDAVQTPYADARRDVELRAWLDKVGKWGRRVSFGFSVHL
jgi:hypothetical protein